MNLSLIGGSFTTEFVDIKGSANVTVVMFT